MAHTSKAYRAAKELITEGQFYQPGEAVAIAKKTTSAKFDSTVASFEQLIANQKAEVVALVDKVSALTAENAQLKWADTAQRGYMVVELTPARATTEYRFVEGIRQRSTRLAGTKRITTEKGSGKLTV